MLSSLTVFVSLVTRKAAFEELVVADSEPRKLVLEGERPVRKEGGQLSDAVSG